MEIQKEFERLHKGLSKINKRLDGFEKRFASKDDLKAFASKDDLKVFATKDDLKAFATKDDLKAFATKYDLIALEGRMDTKFVTKDDLKLAVAEQTTELKQFAEDQTEQLAQIIATTVAEPLDRHLREVSMFEELSMAVWKQISNKQRRA